MSFEVGDVVRLTETCRKVCAEPERYLRGTVTETEGAWRICRVQWNGIDRPIAMRSDEIEHIKEV